MRASVRAFVRCFACRSSSQFIILNPVVGPEPITGSTRMKGGTATKFLLDAALAQALDTFRPATLVDLAFATASRLPDDTVATTRSLSLRTFLAFERTARAVYLCPPGSTTHPLARAVALAGDAIARGGHLYYLGVGIHGILGLIDASECPPTFGAALDDVRGFVQGGWAALGTQGAGVGVPFVDPVEGHLFRLDLADFEREFVGRLTERDVVVAGGLLGGGCVVEGRTDSGERASLARLIGMVRASACTCVCVPREWVGSACIGGKDGMSKPAMSWGWSEYTPSSSSNLLVSGQSQSTGSENTENTTQKWSRG